MKNLTTSLYLSTIGLFLIIVSPTLFSEGMFMDGLLYATISRNLAFGMGDFWNLYLTDFLHPRFFEHPPLALGLQSLFFSIFGDHLWVERAYSVITHVVTAFLMVKIWSMINGRESDSNSWIPLLFWFSVPLVGWAISNNMLENTMMIFTTATLLCFIKYQIQRRIYLLFLSGLFILCAFLTKGFVGLFVLSSPFWFYVLKLQPDLRKFVYQSTIIIFSSLTFLLLLFLIIPESYKSIGTYLNQQVVNSLNYIQTVESRWYILYKMVAELIPAFIFIAVVYYFTRGESHHNPNTRIALAFLLIGFSGVFPIMVSMKQSGFYMLCSFPVFAIGFALLVRPRISILLNSWEPYHQRLKIFRTISYFLFFGGLISVSIFSKGYGRDQAKIEDVKAISMEIGTHTVISSDHGLSKDCALLGYFGRYSNISLYPDSVLRGKYHISPIAISDTLPMGYKKVQLQLNCYNLFVMNR